MIDIDLAQRRRWRGSPNPGIADAEARARGLAMFWRDLWEGALQFGDWTPQRSASSARGYALAHGYTITEQASADLVRVVDGEGRDVVIGRNPFDPGYVAMVVLDRITTDDSIAGS